LHGIGPIPISKQNPSVEACSSSSRSDDNMTSFCPPFPFHFRNYRGAPEPIFDMSGRCGWVSGGVRSSD
jgi:hypothetical protein